MYVDLHLHSCFSDGTHTPAQVAQALHEHSIGIAALADHNSCAGYNDFKAACVSLGITALRGIELDCVYDGMVIHMLGYGFVPEGRIITLADHNKRLLLEMSRDLIRRMSVDFSHISLDEYDSYSYDPPLGGWKGLHYLRNKQIIRELEDGMRLYRQYDCDYSNYPFPSATAVCAAVREASGVPVLAHPVNWFAGCAPPALAAHLDALRAMGIGGIECYYPANTPAFTAACLTYCSRHNLLVTAGSDCHGSFVKRIGDVEYGIGTIMVEQSRLQLGRLLPSH